MNNPEKAIIRYGYVGLVVGYFVYYYLYAGNWDYYFSGVWNRDPNQLAALMSPGLYLFGQPINIPKLFAVPLVLGEFSAISYFLGTWIERQVKSYDRQHHKNSDPDLVRHRIFVICTFAVFNFFFLFAGRPLLQLTPIWVQEEEWVLNGFAPDAGNTQKAESLLARLSEWKLRDRALNHPSLQVHPAILQLLHQGVQHKQELIVRSILEILVSLKDHPSATTIARSLKQLSPHLTTELVSRNSWQSHLHQSIADLLIQSQALEQSAQAVSTQDTLSYLETLLHHYNSVIQGAALFAIAQLDPQRAQTIAQTLQRDSSPSLLHATAERLLALPPSPALTEFPVLEKLVHLSNSDFFDRLQCETLMALGDRSEIKTYIKGNVMTEAGDTCREFLLLIEGTASIQGTDGHTITRVGRLHPGQILDELEVLTHSTLENTILAESERTRIVAIPVDALDDLLERDSSFARRILELEGRQLQRLVKLGTHAQSQGQLTYWFCLKQSCHVLLN